MVGIIDIGSASAFERLEPIAPPAARFELAPPTSAPQRTAEVEERQSPDFGGGLPDARSPEAVALKASDIESTAPERLTGDFRVEGGADPARDASFAEITAAPASDTVDDRLVEFAAQNGDLDRANVVSQETADPAERREVDVINTPSATATREAAAAISGAVFAGVVDGSSIDVRV